MTSPTEEERPRDRMFGWAIDRIATLNTRATMRCQEPTCGTRDADNEVISCSSKHCGEKLMPEEWRRELLAMRDFLALLEALERKELGAKYAAEKRKRR